MEVSNVRDHVTHATISGNKAIDFGISDSPEFFHILSSTLYSDQPLAVVRETMCNAWDAHIEAGCANKPIEITLTDEELIIRDFGHGISDDGIGPIYGVYGGSTKKKNLLVTGGFGLGCKAPFAYTDHFEVTSWHEGEKTIYNMSKSSAEVNGRPGIIPIASFPTDETGLQVRIGLKDRNDKYRFEKLIRRIAANGEMSVLFNGEPLDVLPFSSMKHGFMVTHLPVIETHHNVLIRYGHVIYPVDKHEAFKDEYKYVTAFLSSLPNNHYPYKIIFQAKPNSISVTPSREALSMQEHTINTLTEIFRGFRKFMLSRLEDESINVLHNAIIETWTGMSPSKLFCTEKAIPGLSRTEFDPDKHTVLTELPNIVRAKLCWNYPSYKDFRYRDLLARVDSLIEAKFGNTGLIKSYRSELIRLYRRKKLDEGRTTWFHRKILGPLFQDLKAAGLSTNRLAIYGRSGDRDRFKWNETYFTEAAKFSRQTLEDFLPFLRNIVVLTHNRMAMDRVHNFPVMKHWLGRTANVLVYTVPRTSKPQTDKAREFFKARGVELIDLTVYHPWEEAPKPVVKKTEPVKAKPKGLPILTSLLNGGIRTDFLWGDDKAHDIRRTETPKIIVKLPRREERLYSIGHWNRENTDSICQLWANDIGVAITQSQYDKYLKAGAIDLEKWIIQRVCVEVQSNTRIHRAIAADADNVECLNYQHQLKDLFDVIWSDPTLRKEFGLTNDLTETDKHYLHLWNDLAVTYRYQHHYQPEIKETAEFVSKIKIDPAVEKLSKLLLERKALIENLSLSGVRRNLLTDKISKTPKPVETTRKIVLLALKG